MDFDLIGKDKFLTLVKNGIRQRREDLNPQTIRIINSINTYWDKASERILDNIMVQTRNIEHELEREIYNKVEQLTVDDFEEKDDVSYRREKYIEIENKVESILDLF